MLGRRLPLPLFFVCAALLVHPCGATPFEWELTGSLNAARDKYTGTLLPDGRVLVAGGAGNTILASAELYDPTVGSWTFTGSLNTERSSHTATLLPDGSVLVAGGFNLNIAGLDAAELYDPVSGTWTSTGSLHTGRYEHTATLLANGKVLVAAGFRSPEGNLASAELYDPATGTWSVTGRLNSARNRPTATLLADGRVLVVGGFKPPGQALASAELYDPASGTWTLTGSLSKGRFLHTATLLADGKVLVAGGEDADADTIARAELYDPATGTWTLTGLLNTPRDSHTATLLADGRVLVAGGERSIFNISNGRLVSAELYDPATGKWTVTGSLNTGHENHTATLLPSGEVLVAAGFGNPDNVVATAELYDPGIAVPATVDGRGAIDNGGNQVTFNFHATQADDGSTLGSFSFCDPTAHVCITDAKFHSLSVEGNTAYFVGSASAERLGRVIFNVSATDNGEPGTSDSISIMLGNAYSVSGTLISGDIRIQQGN
jgi:WD40 repeat protein